MTAEEFHTLENPVGMTFWFSNENGNHRYKGVCIRTFKDMALLKYKKHGNYGETDTANLHCRQLRRTKDEPDEVVERPKLEPDPAKIALSQAEEKRNYTKKPTSGTRKPIQDVTTGAIYPSMREADRELGFACGSVKYAIRKNKSIKGHRFIKIEKEEQPEE